MSDDDYEKKITHYNFEGTLEEYCAQTDELLAETVGEPFKEACSISFRYLVGENRDYINVSVRDGFSRGPKRGQETSFIVSIEDLVSASESNPGTGMESGEIQIVFDMMYDTLKNFGWTKEDVQSLAIVTCAYASQSRRLFSEAMESENWEDAPSPPVEEDEDDPPRMH